MSSSTSSLVIGGPFPEPPHKRRTGHLLALYIVVTKHWGTELLWSTLDICCMRAQFLRTYMKQACGLPKRQIRQEQHTDESLEA